MSTILKNVTEVHQHQTMCNNVVLPNTVDKRIFNECHATDLIKSEGWVTSFLYLVNSYNALTWQKIIMAQWLNEIWNQAILGPNLVEL